jgi:hypothetical protein
VNGAGIKNRIKADNMNIRLSDNLEKSDAYYDGANGLLQTSN